MKFKIDDEVTIVYENRYTGRHVGFDKVTKIGTKYIYTVTLWVEQDGTIREGHPQRYSMNDIIIYPGLRHDLRAIVTKHKEDYRQWQERKKRKHREIEWDLRNLVQERLGEWEQNNPIPTLSNLAQFNRKCEKMRTHEVEVFIRTFDDDVIKKHRFHFNVEPEQKIQVWVNDRLKFEEEEYEEEV